MKICAVGPELFHADRLIVAFYKFANAPKKNQLTDEEEGEESMKYLCPFRK